VRRTRARPAATKKPSTSKRTAPPPRRAPVPRRKDYGAPIDGFFAKQPESLRPILEALRALVEEVAPEATSALKWGMPVYSIGSAMLCALGGFRAHVNLVLPGAPGTYADPGGLLVGDGKTGRHLKLTSLEELPRAAVRGWLRTAASLARKKAASG